MRSCSDSAPLRETPWTRGTHPSVGSFQDQSWRDQAMFHQSHMLLDFTNASWFCWQAKVVVQSRRRRTLTPPAWSTFQWLCAHRSYSSV
ncbi:hypothetical protein F7725_016624 [Dissostichus mawsoni]|uniref:Uncharacterized protein n=1 Tax=Dissostichus mawsoni TaxID=36200 RepID=A0A7J5Z449_DISMA|nr:hypothetical protein F7725_016624 [Dissostichus mawsoni]